MDEECWNAAPLVTPSVLPPSHVECKGRVSQSRQFLELLRSFPSLLPSLGSGAGSPLALPPRIGVSRVPVMLLRHSAPLADPPRHSLCLTRLVIVRTRKATKTA